MVEELKLAVKVDDDIIEQSLLKQFNNAEKLADKVVFTFKNVNLDNKEIEKQFKDMQKLAGKNPIELPIDTDKSLKMLQALGDEFTRIISIAKGLDGIKTDFGTKNKTEAYNQLKQMADVFKKFYGNEEAMHSKAGTDAAYAYYKAYEEALKKGVAQSKLERVTVDADPEGYFNANRLSSDRIKDFENFKKYGGELTELSTEISSLESRLLKFGEAFSKVSGNLGEANITPDILKNIEEYVRYLEIAESRAKDADLMGFSKDDINDMNNLANMYLGFAMEDAIQENEKYKSSLKEVREEKEKTDEVIKHSSTSTVDDSKFDELKADVTEIREELNGVKEKISAIDSEGFEHVKADVEKTVESVKELNSELTEVKSKLDNTSASPVETNILSPMKDTFQGDKIEQATTSAKELDKTLEQVNVPKESFDDVIAKFNIIEDKAKNIVKITKDMHRDSDGKPIESYNVTYKDGSNESYGENSNPQLLRGKDVLYDSKQAEKEAKELLAVEKQITKEIEKQEKAQTSAQKKKWKAFENEQKKYTSDQKKTADIEKNKSAYQELLDTIKQYSEVSKRIAKNETLDGDLELAQKLENKISELQKNPILSSSQIAKSERDLVNLFNQLDTLEKKTTKKQSDKSSAQSAKEQAEAWEKNVKAIQEYMDANTKLNNLKAQDAGTGKKAKEIEYNVKKVEELEKAAIEARAILSSMINPHEAPINDWNKWLDVMKQFDQATEGSAESLAKLEDSLRNMAESQFKKVNDTLSNSEKYLELLKPTEGNRSVGFEKVVQEYDRAVNSLKEFHATLDATTPLTKEQSDKFEELANDVKKARIEIDKIPKSQRGSDEDSRMKEIDKLTKYLDANTRISKEAKQQLQGYLALLKSGDPSVSVKELHTAWTKVAVAEREAGREGKRFFDIISDKALYGQAAQLAGYYLSLTDFIRYGKQAVDTIIELDTALIDLKKTTAMSGSEMENFYFEANDVAKEMGVTTQAIIEQSSAWSRLGYNTKEASTEMAKLSSKFATISPGMDTDTAQEGLVSIMKAWDIDVDQVESEVIDKINTLGNNFAEENQDIVEGMKRSAAALASTGTTYQDAFALFTGAQEVLQNSEVTGRALRSISMRIHGYSENSEDGLAELDEELTNITGDLIDLTKTAEHTQGVSIFKDGSTTEFKSLVDYFGEINAIWDEMSQKQQNDFLQMAFGKTQAQAGAALIQNYESVVGALEKMEQSAGSADAEMAAVESSLNYKINSLKETWVGTVQEMIDRGDLGVIIDGLVKLSEAIGFVLDKAGLLGTAGIIGGGILGVKNAGICV